jgi:hypothetical protein
MRNKPILGAPAFTGNLILAATQPAAKSELLVGAPHFALLF